MREFQVLDVTYRSLDIRVRVRWLPLRGGGAIRTRDGEVWDGARLCRRCHTIGYDHGDIDAVLEAQRLGIDHAPHAGGCCP